MPFTLPQPGAYFICDIFSPPTSTPHGNHDKPPRADGHLRGRENNLAPLIDGYEMPQLPKQGKAQSIHTMEYCTVCHREVHGGFEVSSQESKGPDQPFMVIIEGTPDRDFNVCDLCNDTICFDCSIDKDSGYCNVCHAKVYGNTAHQPGNGK